MKEAISRFPVSALCQPLDSSCSTLSHHRAAVLHSDHETTTGIYSVLHWHWTCNSTFPPLQQEIPAFQAKMFQYYRLLSGSCKHDQTQYLTLWKDLNNDKQAYPNDNRGPTCTQTGFWEEIQQGNKVVFSITQIWHCFCWQIITVFVSTEKV